MYKERPLFHSPVDLIDDAGQGVDQWIGPVYDHMLAKGDKEKVFGPTIFGKLQPDH